jgi:hypothetical protein
MALKRDENVSIARVRDGILASGNARRTLNVHRHNVEPRALESGRIVAGQN